MKKIIIMIITNTVTIRVEDKSQQHVFETRKDRKFRNSKCLTSWARTSHNNDLFTYFILIMVISNYHPFQSSNVIFSLQGCRFFSLCKSVLYFSPHRFLIFLRLLQFPQMNPIVYYCCACNNSICMSFGKEERNLKLRFFIGILALSRNL